MLLANYVSGWWYRWQRNKQGPELAARLRSDPHWVITNIWQTASGSERLMVYGRDDGTFFSLSFSVPPDARFPYGWDVLP